MQLAEERAPDGFDDIEAVIPHAELEEIAARYKRAGGLLAAAGQRTGLANAVASIALSVKARVKLPIPCGHAETGEYVPPFARRAYRERRVDG